MTNLKQEIINYLNEYFNTNQHLKEWYKSYKSSKVVKKEYNYFRSTLISDMKYNLKYNRNIDVLYSKTTLYKIFDLQFNKI